MSTSNTKRQRQKLIDRIVVSGLIAAPFLFAAGMLNRWFAIAGIVTLVPFGIAVLGAFCWQVFGPTLASIHDYFRK